MKCESKLMNFVRRKNLRTQSLSDSMFDFHDCSTITKWRRCMQNDKAINRSIQILANQTYLMKEDH